MFWFRKSRARRQEIEAELEACRNLLADRFIEQGVPPGEARRRASAEYSGRLAAQMSEPSSGTSVESCLQDLRYAWRTLRKSPGFTFIAVLTLALGIGVNAAIFSVVYAVLLKPLPYAKPEQLTMIWSDFEKTAALNAPTSGTIFGEIQHRTQLLDGVAAMWPTTGTFIGETDAEQVKYAQVSQNFFSVLGVQPSLGRSFVADENMIGRPAIILTNSLWRRRFGGDPNIIGKNVSFGGSNCAVIGILPEGFRLRLAVGVPVDVEAFVPFFGNIYQRPRTLYFLRLVARMKPGVRVEQAQQEMNGIAAQIRGGYVE